MRASRRCSTQGEIIAGAIASQATVDTDNVYIDPEKYLDLQTGQSISPLDQSYEDLDFSINPEKVAPILLRLISPTRTRARIYDRDGTLIVDSRHLYPGGQILAFDLPPPDAANEIVARDDLAALQPVALQPRPAHVQGTRRRQRPRLSGGGRRAQRRAREDRAHQRSAAS